MDTNILKICPNCFKKYNFDKGKLPLVLTCGHSICENCVWSQVSMFKCSVCLCCMEWTPAQILMAALDHHTISEIYPVNFKLLDELCKINAETEENIITIPRMQALDTNEPASCSTELKWQDPMPLTQGSQEHMIMSHIVDPNNFYLQRASNQRFNKNFIEPDFISLDDSWIIPGAIFLAYNEASEMWQRCTLIEVKDQCSSVWKITVVFFDFGNTQTVSTNNLRLLPLENALLPPPLAIHCSLANCEPVHGTWTPEDNILLQNILDSTYSKHVAIHVRRVVYTECGSKLEVDVTTLRQNVSLVHALVFHGRAFMPEPTLDYVTFKNADIMPRYISNNADFSLRAITDVKLTYIVSPDILFVQSKHNFDEFYSHLCRNYIVQDVGKIFLPLKGMACVLKTAQYINEIRKYIGNRPWARCEVTEIGENGLVQVLLIDSGWRLSVSWDSLRTVTKKFSMQPAMAAKCHLYGVTPRRDNWPEESIAFLNRFHDYTLLMRVVEINDSGSVGVTLFDNTFGIHINNEMIKQEFARPWIFQYQLQDQACALPLNGPVLTDEPNHLSHYDKKNLNKDLRKSCEPRRQEVKVLYCLSPSIIYVALVESMPTYSKMLRKLRSYYMSNEMTRRTQWKVGDRCSTHRCRSQAWLRSTILEIKSGKAKVFYSDYGVTESVSTSHLLELQSMFHTLAPMAIKCEMYGVVPADGDVWSASTKHWLNCALDAAVPFITRLLPEGDTTPVILWDRVPVPRSVLIPEYEWLNLCIELVRYEMAQSSDQT